MAGAGGADERVHPRDRIGRVGGDPLHRRETLVGPVGVLVDLLELEQLLEVTVLPLHQPGEELLQFGIVGLLGVLIASLVRTGLPAFLQTKVDLPLRSAER